LGKLKPLLESKNVSLIAIGNGNTRQATNFVEETKFDGDLYVDPALASYKALNLKHVGRFGTLFSWGMWKKAWKAFGQGFRQSSIQGDGGQLGGVMIVDGTTEPWKILYQRPEAFAGDHAKLEDLLKACDFDDETIKKEIKRLFPKNEHLAHEEDQ